MGGGGVVSDFCTLDFFAAGALVAERCRFFVGIVKPRMEELERGLLGEILALFFPGLNQKNFKKTENI